MFDLFTNQRVDDLHRIVRYGRAAPSFGRSLGVYFVFRHFFPGVKNHLPDQSIIVGSIEAGEVIFYVYTPGAVGTVIHLVFAQHSAVTAI